MNTDENSSFTEDRTLQLISPGTWIIVGGSIFLVCWLFPPRLYERLVGDANYLFCDLQTGLFNALAIGMFYYGIVLTRSYLSRERPYLSRENGQQQSQLLAAPMLGTTEFLLGCCLLLAQVLCIIFLLQSGLLRQWLGVYSGRLNYGELYQSSLSRDDNPVIGLVIATTPYFLSWAYWLWLSNRKPRVWGVILWSLVFTYLLIALPIAKRNYAAWHALRLRIVCCLLS